MIWIQPHSPSIHFCRKMGVKICIKEGGGDTNEGHLPPKVLLLDICSTYIILHSSFNRGALFLKDRILEARQSKYNLSFTFLTFDFEQLRQGSQWLCGNCCKAFHFRQPGGRKIFCRGTKYVQLSFETDNIQEKAREKGKEKFSITKGRM